MMGVLVLFRVALNSIKDSGLESVYLINGCRGSRVETSIYIDVHCNCYCLHVPGNDNSPIKR